MFWKQLKLLLWKNAILRKRHLVRTVIEILWPLFLFAILVAIRQTKLIEINPECHFPARAMPSAGVYPLFKSFICDLQNPCYNKEVPSEVPGQVNLPLDKDDNSTKILSSLLSLLRLLNDDSLPKDDVFDLAHLLQDPNNLNPLAFGNRTRSFVQDFQKNEKFTEIVQSLTPLLDNDKESFSKSILGIDFSSPNGFKQFCRHSADTSSNSSAANDTNENSMNKIFANFTSDLNISSPSFCSDLKAKLEDKNNTGLHVLFNLVKPFVLGKIPFYPNTSLVREIITNANATFETLWQMQKFGEYWESSIGPTLYDRLENGQITNFVRDTLNSSMGFDQLISSRSGVTVAQLKALRAFLSNEDNPNDDKLTWKDIFHQVNTTIIWATKFLSCAELNKFVGYDDEDELVKHSLQRVDNKTLWASIVFLSPNATTPDDAMPKIIKYQVRQDASSVTRTSFIQRYVWTPGSESNSTAVSQKITQGHPVRYYISGFVHVQDMIENAILLTRANYSGLNTSIPVSLGSYLQEMPYPCYTKDEFLEFLPGLFSLLMTLAWVYSVCIIIKNIVYEKEKRLKEVMKMMGLGNGVHWVAWFINSFSVMLVSILFLLICLRLGKILPYSNMLIVFLWLTSFTFATITQCFLISCFFTKANLAAACGGILYFVLYIPYNLVYIFENEMTYPTKLLACLLSSVSFGYGAGFISQFEMSGDGIQFSNWNQSIGPSEKMTFLTSVVMMLVDSVIYMTLTWYIENVYPGTYGVPKRWNFFMKSSYWLGKRKGRYESLVNDCNSEISVDEGVRMEKEPTHLNLGVSMHRLRKVFDNGKVAVDGLSLNFYEGQITSFLGHNGAGKTTTMSMLTGLYTPTSGSASIYGSDIQTDMDQVRHQLGFCPQHNVLFGDLTVLEHLEFYSGLKNAVGGVKQDPEELETMLKHVGLPHKRHEIARHLSGGMKRKLSVAVAFIGNSKCVILDEPTAGVDPYARRGIWDLLLRYRADRTILLSTHHMDEADLLGDRIAIISHGKLKCCGSSLFLKSTYGVGYYLTIVKDDDDTSSNENLSRSKANSRAMPPDLLKDHSDSVKLSDEGFGSSSDLSWQPSTSRGASPSRRTITFDPVLNTDSAQFTRINNLVFSVIPQAKVQEDNQREVTFVLPYTAQSGGRYCRLFQRLDDCGITYGLTDTSLEEIFMNVAEQSDEHNEEETVKCCFCIPRKVKHKSRELESPDGQARRGLRRSVTTRSITSNFSGHSSAPLYTQFEDDDVSLILEDTGEVDVDAGDDNLFVGGENSLDIGSYKVKGRKLVWQQFKALLAKRFHHSKRNRKGLIAQVVVPAGFIALGLLCSLAAPPAKNDPPLELQPWMYGNTYSFYSNDNPSDNLAPSVAKSLLDKPSLGMKCVNNYRIRNFNGSVLSCDITGDNEFVEDDLVKSYSQPLTSNETLTCQCTTNNSRVLLADCPYGAGGTPTSRAQTLTLDWLYNMTGRNLSDWLVKTVDRFIGERYGGLSLGGTLHTSLSPELVGNLVGFAQDYSNFTLAESTGVVSTVSQFAQNLARTENSKVWFDNNGFHSMPTWMNVKNNAAFRSLLKSDENAAEFGIVAINHPLNFTNSSLDAAARTSAVKWTIVSVCVIFALSFIPASFVLFLIDEKVTKSKHLQFVSGVNATIYWISTFVWDMLNYMVSISLIILIFFAFQTKAYVSAENFPCLVLLLLLYGFSITPIMYPASFYFEVPSTAYVVLTCINIFVGINASIVTFILQGLNLPYLDAVNDKLRIVFLIFPQYCLGRGLLDMAVGQSYADAISQITGVDKAVSPFDFDVVGRNLLVMAIEGVVFFGLTLLIQYRYFTNPCRSNRNNPVPTRPADADSDVVSERRRIWEGRSNDILKIRNLSKVYKKRGTNRPLVAVDRLCVGVPEGECFGLLGVNGAGKTTTFKMLTGDTSPTNGDATICGQSILDNLREVQQNTGYCPQFEALNSLLTGRQHLKFYAKLRGVPPSDVNQVADWSINKFGLRMYADKPAGTYSGGNKRKLSAAIAFIGAPPIVFLDEPTAGMDPMSRRFLWARISEAVRCGRSVVLTSHSMEECEALCTRLAIMVNGRLKCIGSPQHLKNRYGEGYTITIKVIGGDSNYEKVKNSIKLSFNNAVIKESHCNMLIYQLPFNDVKLSKLFVILDNFKKSMMIEDYSINQTTLDEVFVSFAKNQTDSSEDEYGFQPLNDDSVTDYTQVTDRARESNLGTDIAMIDLTADNARETDSMSSQLLV